MHPHFLFLRLLLHATGPLFAKHGHARIDLKACVYSLIVACAHLARQTHRDLCPMALLVQVQVSCQVETLVAANMPLDSRSDHKSCQEILCTYLARVKSRRFAKFEICLKAAEIATTVHVFSMALRRCKLPYHQTHDNEPLPSPVRDVST